MHVLLTRALPGTALVRLAAERTVTVSPCDEAPSREQLVANLASAAEILDLSLAGSERRQTQHLAESAGV